MLKTLLLDNRGSGLSLSTMVLYNFPSLKISFDPMNSYGGLNDAFCLYRS